MIPQDEVAQGVRECLMTALDLSAEEITESAKLVDDLGADSLDLLDLTFQLEQRFGIRMSPRDIERRVRHRLNGGELEVDGIYTPEALALFREAMPEVPPEELADGLTVSELPRCFRVTTIANLVRRLLEEHAAEEGRRSHV